MIGSKCRHKLTGTEGFINSELDGTKDFPDQWGIFWVIRYDKNTTNHYYWNDKTNIEIIDNDR
jgi:hypothetical protein